MGTLGAEYGVIPRGYPHFGWNELAALAMDRAETISSIERQFADFYGYGYAVWFGYGRVAIRAFLETLRDCPKRVVVSPFNCVAVGNGIVAAGWKPIYVDTEVEGFNACPEEFDAAMRHPEAGAGIAVSLWGIPSGFDQGVGIEKPLLHDFALRSLDGAKPNLRPRDGVLYSVNWGKPLPSVRGGFLCCHDPGTARSWRDWRDEHMLDSRHPRIKELVKAAVLRTALDPAMFRLTNWLVNRGAGSSLNGRDAASSKSMMPGDWNRPVSSGALAMIRVGLKQREILALERERQVLFYLRELRKLNPKDFQLPTQHAVRLSHFPLRLPRSRTEIKKNLESWGIFSSDRLYDILLSDDPRLKGDSHSDLPRARELCRTTLHLPLYSGMAEAVQTRVVNALGKSGDAISFI